MNQLDRIRYMEEIMDQLTILFADIEPLIEEYETILPKLHELMRYYESNKWKQDFYDDSLGKFPSDLKRGVLSEDGIYNLLDLHNELLNIMKKIINTRESNV